MKVALFQFAANAVGKVPAVLEHMLGLVFQNALVKAAGLDVVDLTPLPREGEIITLAGTLPPEQVDESASRVGAGAAVWGELAFKPENSPVLEEMEIGMRVLRVGTGEPPSTFSFRFRAMRGDVRSTSLSVDVAALEDLVEEMVAAVCGELGIEDGSLRVDRIGEGLSLSDRALVYFVYALRLVADKEAKIKLYRRAISADPRFALAHINLAQVLLGEGRYGEAMNALLRAHVQLKGSEAEPDILNLLGVATMNLGMWEDAVRVWKRSLELSPGHPEVLCNLASAFAMRDMLAEAEDHYRRALEGRPDFPLAWFSLGKVMVQEGKYAAAEEAVYHYIDLCPGDPWAYFLLGTCQMELGKVEEARFSLSKAVQLDPSGEVGKLARSKLEG